MVRVPLRQEPNGSHTIAPNHLFCDMLYKDLTLCVETQRAMPEAKSTWTKRVGAEPNQQNKHSNEVPEPKPKRLQCTHDANLTVS